MVSPITDNPFDGQTHIKHFAEFCRGVEFAGGTTPHMLMAVEACNRQDSVQEKLWWAGCYAFVYNFATAEMINREWRPGEWVGKAELESWATENWKGLKFRKERRAARSPKKLAVCMDTYGTYMKKVPERDWFTDNSIHPRERYFMAFDDICKEVKYMGRYIGIRWVEVINRVFDTNTTMPDLLPKGGEHPRKALALMYPDYHDPLMGGNDADTIKIVNGVVETCLNDLYTHYGVDTDYYTIQSLLCEYKQSVLGRKQYPGKSVDTAITYWNKIYDEWWGEEEAEKSIMWDVRKKLFPLEMLGEVQGWNGVRDELGGVLREYEYTWSDYVYDYMKTTDLGSPYIRNKDMPEIFPSGKVMRL
jgi:hypothetical protein